MRTSITVCGQSNARGQWQTENETEDFPPQGIFDHSGMTQNPTVPFSNSGNQGHSIWPYVARLLVIRHGRTVQFWNAAVGSTSLETSWNGGVAFGDGPFDPNSHYSNAKTQGFDLGTFDNRYVLCQWGNADFALGLTQAQVKFALEQFVDFWQDAGATGILLGGTVLSGSPPNEGPVFMRDVWKPACLEVIAANTDVHLGAFISDEFNYNSTGYLQTDNTHLNKKANYIAAEAWYRAIANVLGLPLSTHGKVNTAFPALKIS